MNFYFYIIQSRKSYKNKVHVKKYQIKDPKELKTALINQKNRIMSIFSDQSANDKMPNLTFKQIH